LTRRSANNGQCRSQSTDVIVTPRRRTRRHHRSPATMINPQNSAERRHRVSEIRTFVAGSQFHERDLMRNELLHLIREPFNTTNQWAIRVADTRSRMVGYLPRPLTKLLAPLMDQGLLRVIARVSVSPYPGVAKAFTLRIIKLRVSPPSRGQAVVSNPPHRPLAECSGRIMLVPSISNRRG